MAKRKTPGKGEEAGAAREWTEMEKLEKELEEIRKTLEELRQKIGFAEGKERTLTKLPIEAMQKASETFTEIAKTATDVLGRALKLSQSIATGAIEGAKKALEEQKKGKGAEE
jgi:cell division septum initiation protein DivIVA